MPIEPESLLAHGDFVRVLARRLVLDDQSADDVAQQTWLAALERPPRISEALPAWLARVARNFAFMTRRVDKKRAEREKAAAAPEAVPSASEIYEREALRRRVIDEVLALEKAYRSAVLLRFYEDLPPREIAARLAIPVETVKTRLKRGLAKLRERLDAEFGNDRGAWCLALAPIAGLKVGASSAAAAAGPAAAAAAGSANVVTGVIAMSTKIKIGAAALLIAGACTVLWQVLSDGGNGSATPAPVVEDVKTGREIVSKEIRPDRKENGPDLAGEEVERPAKEIVQPAGFFVSGQVIDKKTGGPVPVFDLEIDRHTQKGPAWITVVHETVADQQGRFSFPLEMEGRHRIWIRSSRYLDRRTNFEIADRKGVSGLLIELDPSQTVSGRVVEQKTGRPLPDVIVCSTESPGRWGLDWLLLGHGEYYVHATTDEEGCFILQGLKKGKQTLAALHPDFAEGFVETDTNDEEPVEIRLKPGFRLHGRAYDDDGKPVARVAVKMWGPAMPYARTVLTESDGSFLTAPVPPGWIHMEAMPPPNETEESINFTSESKNVEIIDRGLEVVFGPMPEHITWRGALYDYDGSIVPGATINLFNRNYQDYPRYDRDHLAKTDSQGRFVLRKLLSKEYQVSIVFPNYSVKVAWDDIAFDRPGTVERDIRIGGGVISGTVIDALTGAPVNTEPASIMAIESNPPYKSYLCRTELDGKFCLRGMPPGVYSISCSITGYPSPRIPRVTLEKGQVIEEMRIEVSLGGTLSMVLSGFDDLCNREFKVFLNREGASSSHRFGEKIGADGSCMIKRSLKPESYTAEIVIKGMKPLKRPFTIAAGETFELPIAYSELEKDRGVLCLIGSLTYPGGRPLPGAHLFFFDLASLDAPPGKDVYFSVTTDTEGRFKIDQFKPGRWSVNVTLSNGGEFEFPDLDVSEDEESPFTLDLVLQEGKVSGTLVDKLSGVTFSDDGPVWWIYLYNADTDELVNEIQGGRRGPRFELAGLPGGEYYLYVAARGFENHKSEPFYLADGRDLDVGEIRLEPSGVLDVEVVDAEGKHVQFFSVFCESRKLEYNERKTLSLGKCRCYTLPLGAVNMTVKAKGFEDQTVSVFLEAGKAGTVRVEMHPAQ